MQNTRLLCRFTDLPPGVTNIEQILANKGEKATRVKLADILELSTPKRSSEEWQVISWIPSATSTQMVSLYATHIPTTSLQKALLSLGSSLAVLNPSRGGDPVFHTALIQSSTLCRSRRDTWRNNWCACVEKSSAQTA